jgi:spermidine synthase
VPPPRSSADDSHAVVSGQAELLADADRPGGWLLLVDRVRQSYVDLNDPTYLDLEYVQHFACAVDALPEGPLAVTHIGGGAMCFPRYIAATRPGSPQIVFEPDEKLTTLVRQRLPLPKTARVRVRPQFGRQGMAQLRDASADIVVLDAFLGARVPMDLTTAEFFAEAARTLRPEGLLIANIADGAPMLYLRRVLAAAALQFSELLIVVDPAVLKGRRYGNVVFCASRAALPAQTLKRYAAGAMFPLRVMDGEEIKRFVAGALPFRDDDAERSPAPPDELWRMEEDW